MSHYRSPQTPGIDVSGAGSPFTAAETTRLIQLADIIGVQGDIIYHNGSAWVALGYGTSGYFLKTQGIGANPVWDVASGISGDIAQSKLEPSSNETISAHQGAVIPDHYEIVDTYYLEIEDTAIFQII